MRQELNRGIVMRKKLNLNQDWQFHLGEINKPKLLAKKSYAFGGLTAPLTNEKGDILPISAGGEHFLKLISGGHVPIGLRNLAGTELVDKLDDSWETISVPDDWKRREAFENNPATLMQGSKPDGVAYYRHTFTLASDLDEQKEYVLHFDGVMGSTDIWMNGAYLGHNESGYVSIDLDVSDLIRFADEGTNVILVRTDTTTGSEGWWYEGAGIYKNVWLEVREPVHIDQDSVLFRTLDLQSDQAKMQVQFTVVNDTDKAVEVAPKLTLTEQSISWDAVTVSAHEKSNFVKELVITNPDSWSPEHPSLYQANLAIDGDEAQTHFGIKIVKYDTKGFILNGERYELRGVCEHQDFGGVGVALNQDVIDYKIKTLKEMGVNALRSSHHFASKELLDACDRLGIILMDENRLLEATPWRLDNLRKMVKKSRNHACIAFWSIANEEIVGNTEYAKRSVKRITDIIRQLDQDKLLVSAELLNPEGIVNDDYLKYFDILGVNYPEAGVMGNGAELIHESHPDLPMMSTENASYFSTRGIYKDDGDKCQCNNFGSMYSMVLPGKRKPGDPGVGGTAHPEEVMSYLDSHSYMGGVFVWTGLDYYGEPSPFGWPGISSQFGICDLGGLPKDYYYYYQAHWTKKPMVHVMPHWNEAGLEIENGQTKVRAFSNADEVELFINGKRQGRRKVEGCQANWDVTYEAGTLEVKAYQDGQEVASDKRVTSGTVQDVQVAVRFEGEKHIIFELQAVDEQGLLVPMDDSLVSVECENGKIIGLTNGNPADTSSYSLKDIKLFSGKAIVIVECENLKSAKLTIKLR